MSRISNCFSELSSEGKKALIVYVVAGDPDLKTSLDVMHALVENGVDLIELGVPFTDPEADGPVIQLAAKRALESGTTLDDCLNLVHEFRKTNEKTPVVLMGYLNPIEQMGYEKFASEASRVGVDGIISVNVPPEEGVFLDKCLIDANIDPVYLLAPTTTASRAKFLFSRGRGFAYYVSLKGTTGSSNLNVDEVRGRLDELRKHGDLPIAVGFGIKTGEIARQVASFADGIAVGAAVVSIMEENIKTPGMIPEKVGALVATLRAAMDGNGA